MMSSYKHVGSYTKSKCVIVLYNRNQTKIDDVSMNQEGMLLRFWMKINNKYVRILACYSPLDGDKPEFFLLQRCTKVELIYMSFYCKMGYLY